MGQNNNQNSTGQGFKKDDAYQTLSMINTWIGNIDTKISFALALAGDVYKRQEMRRLQCWLFCI